MTERKADFVMPSAEGQGGYPPDLLGAGDAHPPGELRGYIWKEGIASYWWGVFDREPEERSTTAFLEGPKGRFTWQNAIRIHGDIVGGLAPAKWMARWAIRRGIKRIQRFRADPTSEDYKIVGVIKE